MHRAVSGACVLAAPRFEIGPAAYTPGTKVPQQTIGAREDREALVKFLEKATKN